MIKFRLYYDKDKEEKFLNSMSAKGYAMKSFFLGFFWFEKSKPNEYTYRIDLIQGKTKKEIKDYINIIEDSGAEFIQKWGMWIFFRKKGNFELYTDKESQIERYTRIRNVFGMLSLIELLVLYSQIKVLFTSNNKMVILTILIIFLIYITFFFQMFKCNSKINELKS